MKFIVKPFAKLLCPECGGKLQGTASGIEGGCLTAIGVELLFWVSIGIAAILISNFTEVFYTILSAIFITAIVLIGISRTFASYKCKSCGIEIEFDKAISSSWLSKSKENE